ncbi:MAG: tRNA/rRNA methyltransferase [Candidatus Cloacimonetes bacterium]|nr:tRNA/rRNA methyltransferase [Candidatus Cloacimonadota bacterium]
MDQICFILVEPQVPQNVGAAARALKTMGFTDLRLVDSRVHHEEPARWLAHGAAEILNQIIVFDTLKDAVRDCDFCVGTTARFRNRRKDYHSPQALLEIIRNKGQAVRRVAVIFGREESGLTNEEIDLCDIISTIPMKTAFPSLNLAQAVMIYAYVLSCLPPQDNSKFKFRKNEHSQQTILKQKIMELSEILGLSEKKSFYTRLLERSSLLRDFDMRLVHTIIEKIRDRITSL